MNLNNKINVLVTGCGGDIGQSICKILNMHPIINNVIGVDIHQNHPGKFLCDQYFDIPKCNDSQYLQKLFDINKNKSIDVVVPASEPELRWFATSLEKLNDLNVPFVMANSLSMRIGFDKLSTIDFLKINNLPFPETKIIKDTKSISFPSILKSRIGAGSNSIFLLKNIDDYKYYKSKYPNYLVQEYLKNENEEYTCGVYRNKKGVFRSIVFRRTLRGGFSNFGEVVQNNQINELLEIIATKLNLIGAINIQLILTNKGPKVFEINPRFSSTVLFRHLFGFEDLMWSILDILNVPYPNYKKATIGKKFYKGFSEYIDE